MAYLLKGIKAIGRLLLRIIERMYCLNLSVYDVNPVKNVIHSIHGLYVEDGCNVIALQRCAALTEYPGPSGEYA
jgi:hypothetical protein